MLTSSHVACWALFTATALAVDGGFRRVVAQESVQPAVLSAIDYTLSDWERKETVGYDRLLVSRSSSDSSTLLEAVAERFGGVVVERGEVVSCRPHRRMPDHATECFMPERTMLLRFSVTTMAADSAVIEVGAETPSRDGKAEIGGMVILLRRKADLTWVVDRVLVRFAS